MIRVGIVGLGKMGISHHAIFNAQPGARVSAVCDTTGFILSTLKKHVEVETYKDYKDMIDSGQVDCVVVATPTKYHFETAKYALERGIHAFVEKPFCLSLDEARTLVDLAEKKKLVNQVGYHNRFIGTFMEVRRLVKSGALGQVFHVFGEAYGPVVVREPASTWRTKKSEGGGCLHDYCSHVVDLMNYVVGPPKQVLGSNLPSFYSKDVEDAVYATLSYGNGTSGQIATNWSDETHRKMTTRITVQGQKGKVFADRQEIQVYLKEDAGVEGYGEGWTIRYITDLQKPVAYYLRGEEYSAQAEHFLDCIRNKRTDNLNSFRSALETDTVIDQLARAAKRS
jgi:scyllo-inositol 2-dehydrogenase (NADP+)